MAKASSRDPSSPGYFKQIDLEHFESDVATPGMCAPCGCRQVRARSSDERNFSGR
jgi:hypothetical protein